MSRRPLWALGALFLAAAALPHVGIPAGSILADPLSEVPVKLWGFETFARVGLLGGEVADLAFPDGGVLNNPDPAGTLVTAALRPLLGRLGAWNGLLVVVTLANLVAMAMLAWEVTRSRTAAAFAAVSFALTPLLLVYGMASAVSDILHVWPYALAVRSTLRALRTTGWRDPLLAGAWAGIGVATCVYDAAVFSILVVPLLPFAGTWTDGRLRAILPRTLLGIGLALAVVGGPFLWETRAITRSERSLLRADDIEATRHKPPYLLLEPGNRDRYVAYLADYVAVGSGGLVVRDNASRYYRAFSPGLSSMALALYAAVSRRREALPWLLAAAFAAIASTGPYLPVTGALSLPLAMNPVWLGLFHAWPGASLLLEPFRYGLAAAFALALAAGIGVAAVTARWGPTSGALAVAVWLTELLALSPVPFPLPSTDLAPTAGWEQVGDRLPAGGILALPYYVDGEDLFNRRHFYEQLLHGHPIPDQVIGFVPRYLQRNRYIASLLEAENSVGRLHVEMDDATRLPDDRRRFREAGFAAVVVDPRGFAEGDLPRVLSRLGGKGRAERVGELYVFRLE